jgi:hypothetical protein
LKVSEIAAFVAAIGSLFSGIGTLIAAVRAIGYSKWTRKSRRRRRH